VERERVASVMSLVMSPRRGPPAPNLFCEPPYHLLGFRQRNVKLESILRGHRLRRPIRHDCTVVDAASEFV